MWSRLDLVLRFAYVALVPMFLAALSKLMPIGGVVGGTAVATIIALVGPDRWRQRVERIRYVGRVLGGFGRLGEYYRDHPPKPLVYYIAYPAFFPYWLLVERARREFLLYRKLNMLALVIVAITGVVDYFRKWTPLPIPAYIGNAFGSFVLQLIVTFAIVMPIVTTVLVLHARNHKRWLAALVVVGALTAAAGLAVRGRLKTIPYDVSSRIKARMKHFEDGARAAQHAGLEAAVSELGRGGNLDSATARAHDALDDFYRRDEAAVFQLWSAGGTVMLYARLGRGRYVWLARDATHEFADPADPPAGARELLSR